MSDETLQVWVEDVLSYGSTETGERCFIRIQSDSHQTFDLVVPYQSVTMVNHLLCQAYNAAYQKRRALGVTDQAVPITSPTVDPESFGFAVAEDKSSMRLLVQTRTGQYAISIPRDHAKAFAENVARNVEFLLAPPRAGAN